MKIMSLSVNAEQIDRRQKWCLVPKHSEKITLASCNFDISFNGGSHVLCFQIMMKSNDEGPNTPRFYNTAGNMIVF